MMPIGVYIDSNVWDFLFDRQLDLAVELPKEDFCLCITREAEFEIPAIPPHKADLKAFIASTIERCRVKTDCLAGFNDDSLPQAEQRLGGFDVGRWATPEEIAFIHQQHRPLRALRKRPTKLYKDEADIALAARSFLSIVLSLDAKKGPINDAYKQGGKVVFLSDFDEANLSLADFIRRACPDP